MRKPEFILALLVALGCNAVKLHAEFVIGRYSGEFLTLGAGGRALAMGGASVASPTPANATYYNPSALAQVTSRHAEFMHASQFDNTYTYDYLSYAQRLPNGSAAGVTALYARVGDIPMTRLADPNQPLSDNNRVVVRKRTSDHELALIAALGKTAARSWRIGGSAKLLMKSVAGETALGIGLDLAAGRTIGRNLDVGISARDITTSVLAWSTGRTEGILPSVVAGAAWWFEIPRANARVTIAGDLESHFESRGEAEQVSAGPFSTEPHVGLEYLIANTIALRGGFTGDNLTAGAGLRFAWLNLSAAFQNHEDLGFSHRVSVGVNW